MLLYQLAQHSGTFVQLSGNKAPSSKRFQPFSSKRKSQLSRPLGTGRSRSGEQRDETYAFVAQVEALLISGQKNSGSGYEKVLPPRPPLAPQVALCVCIQQKTIRCTDALIRSVPTSSSPPIMLFGNTVRLQTSKLPSAQIGKKVDKETPSEASKHKSVKEQAAFERTHHRKNSRAARQLQSRRSKHKAVMIMESRRW